MTNKTDIQAALEALKICSKNCKAIAALIEQRGYDMIKAEDQMQEWRKMAFRIDKALTTLAEQMRWRPIESCPKNGDVFIAKFGDSAAYLFVYCMADGRIVPSAYSSVVLEPTHWLPLDLIAGLEKG